MRLLWSAAHRRVDGLVATAPFRLWQHLEPAKCARTAGQVIKAKGHAAHAFVAREPADMVPHGDLQPVVVVQRCLLGQRKRKALLVQRLCANWK